MVLTLEVRMDRSFFRGKGVLIMGLGRFGGGADAAKFAWQSGCHVTVTDMAPREKLADTIEQLTRDGVQAEYHLGQHCEEDFTGPDTDIVIVNPAIREGNPCVEAAKQAGKFITSQIELFFELFPGQIVGITGSNGKSTTTALTACLLEAGIGQDGIEYNKVHLGGNIGKRPLLAALDEFDEKTLAVLELSSFQLEQLAHIEKSARVALVTNVTPNHLDAHGTLEAYIGAKENLFRFQDGQRGCVSIFNGQDVQSVQWYKKYAQEQGRKCELYYPEQVGDEYLDVFRLAGKMNQINLAGALAVARSFKVQEERLIMALDRFTGLEDRLELVDTIAGVRWYNDTISTTPESTIAAIEGFSEGKILIAGGYDKGMEFYQLGEIAAAMCKGAVLIGNTARKIAEAICLSGKNSCQTELVNTLEDAVQAAWSMSEPGDVVLMSPACASYDMFDDYRHRGRVFKEAVSNLARQVNRNETI